ncbi:hypothetical protein E2C01_076662 [Portunus trituberculatus]|uniref:Uncharacterized protein n=1 Tax=Portunus trituberculatus TaxID=210409 RepID=A0A5B7IJ92_PORTR|nr:hypothetical protein [Portunus trituberculatus]
MQSEVEGGRVECEEFKCTKGGRPHPPNTHSTIHPHTQQAHPRRPQRCFVRLRKCPFPNQSRLIRRRYNFRGSNQGKPDFPTLLGWGKAVTQGEVLVVSVGGFPFPMVG